jgi:peptide deformylase
MALLTILTDENPRLRLKSHKVTKFDRNLRDLAQNMLESMDNANGIGLAAPQVGVLQRLIVIDIPKDLEFQGSEPFHAVVVNPEIIKCSGEQIGEEGCLSVPDWYGEVKRYEFITVRGQDVTGKPIRIKAEGLPARCLQHEIDHLDGILFTDKIVDAATLHKVKRAEEAETRELVKVI